MDIFKSRLVRLVKGVLTEGLGSLAWVEKRIIRQYTDQHTSESTRIIIVLEGMLTVETSSIGLQSFGTGSGFILDPWAWYKIKSLQYNYLELVLSPSRLEVYQSTHLENGMNKKILVIPRSFRDDSFVRMEKILAVLQADSERDSIEIREKRASIFELFLIYVKALLEDHPPKKIKFIKLFETLIAYISDNYLCSSFNRMSIAAKFGINESYVNTIIVRGLGCKFKEYLTLKRLEYSRRVLRESKLKIKDLAPTFGYSDATIFIVNFRIRYKLTPRKMRSLINKKDISISEKRLLHHVNMIDELEYCENLNIKSLESARKEKTLLFLCNLTNDDISVFSCGQDSKRFLLECIPKNSRVEVNAPRGSLLEVIGDHQKNNKVYKVAETPCIVYYS